VGYAASGHVGVDTPLGVITLPLEAKGTLELPRAPQVALGSPKVMDLSLTGATLELPLTITNGNAFALPLGALAGALRVEGAEVGSLQTPELGTVAGGAAQTVAVPVRIRFAEALSAARALRSGTAHIDLRGELRGAGASLPF